MAEHTAQLNTGSLCKLSAKYIQSISYMPMQTDLFYDVEKS